ncbi:hypothetical protein [Sporomusa rhizae]|uniref:hypothetical protein n=1 Tax=Sporomusa rhizae TaxID=357999 RepID=UPI00352B3A3D
MTEYQIRRLTMSSHETPVAAHRKPVLITVSCLAEGAHRPRRPNPRRRAPCGRACRQQGSRGLRGGRNEKAAFDWKAASRNFVSAYE